MGYICLSCGEGLPEDTPCPCEMGYDDPDDDELEELRFILAAEIGLPIPYSAPPDDVSSQAECAGQCLVHCQHIYILCYGRPVPVRSQDYLPGDPSRKYPISHYVGWTRQRPPIKRVRQQAAAKSAALEHTRIAPRGPVSAGRSPAPCWPRVSPGPTWPGSWA